MAKKTTPDKPAPKDKPDGKPARPKESWRDTIESIVFAFVLAFLFRTFEAEAFVIPTGSMAPTLFGRHKECFCEKCGERIIVGASDEVDADTGELKGTVDKEGRHIDGVRLETAVCPNCRYRIKDLRSKLAFNGDRILVNKYPYEFGDPDRFDVFVFKWPEKPETNYIKRLVGLPNETIRIRQGDLYLWDPTAQPAEQILRKDNPRKQRSLQIPVYDDDHPPEALIAAGWPERWHGMSRTDAPSLVPGWQDEPELWKLGDDAANRHYQLGATPELAWLRYRNFMPQPRDWDAAAKNELRRPQAELISDFCGYNAYTTNDPHENPDVDDIDYGPFWVGDLTVNFELQIDESAPDSEILLELVEGVRRYRCRIHPATGAATLFFVDAARDETEERDALTAQTGIVGPGTYEISFANVDDRLCLWIDDDLVDFGPEAAYRRDGLGHNLPTPDDLSPVGIAARGVAARVAHVRLERDIYYRADSQELHRWDPSNFRRDLANLLSDPSAWARRYDRDAEEYDVLDLSIPEGHYLALGDNSPRSSDSRLWRSDMQTVPRDYLVGKAFFIYWPHGVPFLNDGQGFEVWPHSVERPNDGVSKVSDYPRFTAPFYPQITRMRRIR